MEAAAPSRTLEVPSNTIISVEPCHSDEPIGKICVACGDILTRTSWAGKAYINVNGTKELIGYNHSGWGLKVERMLKKLPPGLVDWAIINSPMAGRTPGCNWMMKTVEELYKWRAHYKLPQRLPNPNETVPIPPAPMNRGDRRSRDADERRARYNSEPETKEVKGPGTVGDTVLTFANAEEMAAQIRDAKLRQKQQQVSSRNRKIAVTIVAVAAVYFLFFKK